MWRSTETEKSIEKNCEVTKGLEFKHFEFSEGSK